MFKEMAGGTLLDGMLILAAVVLLAHIAIEDMRTFRIRNRMVLWVLVVAVVREGLAIWRDGRPAAVNAGIDLVFALVVMRIFYLFWAATEVATWRKRDILRLGPDMLAVNLVIAGYLRVARATRSMVSSAAQFVLYYAGMHHAAIAEAEGSRTEAVRAGAGEQRLPGRMIAGGDVKLLAACTLLVGSYRVGDIIVAVCISSLLVLARRVWMANVEGRRLTGVIPYGPHIALGTVYALGVFGRAWSLIAPLIPASVFHLAG